MSRCQKVCELLVGPDRHGLTVNYGELDLQRRVVGKDSPPDSCIQRSPKSGVYVVDVVAVRARWLPLAMLVII